MDFNYLEFLNSHSVLVQFICNATTDFNENVIRCNASVNISIVTGLARLNISVPLNHSHLGIFHLPIVIYYSAIYSSPPSGVSLRPRVCPSFSFPRGLFQKCLALPHYMSRLHLRGVQRTIHQATNSGSRACLWGLNITSLLILRALMEG
jgi:hypothetical protein